MGLNDRLKFKDAVFVDGGDISSTVTSTAIRTGEGGQLGQTKIILVATADVKLADATEISLKAQDSNDGSTGFGDIAEAKATNSSGGVKTYAVGDLIAEVVLPRTANEFSRVVISSTDTGITGNVDCYCSSPTGTNTVA